MAKAKKTNNLPSTTTIDVGAEDKIKVTYKGGRIKLLTLREALSPRVFKQLSEGSKSLLTNGRTISSLLSKSLEGDVSVQDD